MKIGILTYHKTSNFGSVLQAYSLYRKVADLGYDCEIINYINDAVEKRETPLGLKDCTSPRNIAYYFLWEPKLRKKIRRLDYFMQSHTQISAQEYRKNNIALCADKYDTFLIGSDLVWDFNNNGHDAVYMLDFLDDGHKKIAYASSCGKVWEEKDEVTALLNRFDHIGVREREIQQTLSSWLDKPVDFVCDPTMLIEPERWKALASGRQIREPYVLCYFEDHEKKIYKDALKYAGKHNLPVYAISYKRLPKGIRAVRPTDVEDFLSLILQADSVFSASYHGMLFSLYFNKNLYYYKKGWNARQTSLAALCGIEDRDGYNGEKKIDYGYVNAILQKFREESVGYLSDYLKNP